MEHNSKYETSGAPAVDRALDVLEYLERCSGHPTLSEIAAELSLPKASAHRLLTTLKARGYVRVESAHVPRGFVLGPRVLGLAARAQQQFDIVRAAHAPMRDLANATDEGCQLSVRVGGQALCVARVASPLHPEVSLLGRVGSMLPLHAVAVGKVLLAFAGDEEQTAYLSNQTLEAFTPHTHTDPAALAGELVQIKHAGLARDEQEYKRGLRAYAAPVFAHDGTAAGALAVPVLTGAGGGDDARIIDALRTAASEISRALGHQQELLGEPL